MTVRLAWYERREPLIRAALGQDAPAVAEYELLNPMPLKSPAQTKQELLAKLILEIGVDVAESVLIKVREHLEKIA